MTTCRRCFLPEGKLGVQLDTDQICNYCHHFDRERDRLMDFDRLSSCFAQRLDRLRGAYEFDALVGLSGGKDGTYVLTRLVKEHKLNVLAVTFDNGFLCDDVRQNVEHITRTLNVPHMYYRPEWSIHQQLYRAALAKVGHVCLGCGLAGSLALYRLCYEKRIPFWIHGRDPYQMFRQYDERSDDIYLTFIKSSYEEHSFARLLAVYQMIEGKLKILLQQLLDDPAQREQIKREFALDAKGITPDFFPDFLGYFVFHPYNEASMRQYIADEVGYTCPPSHSDCLVHTAVEHIFKRIHGIGLSAREIAVMRRQGAISRSAAMTMFAEADKAGDSADASIDYLCSRLDLSRRALEETIQLHWRKASLVV